MDTIFINARALIKSSSFGIEALRNFFKYATKIETFINVVQAYLALFKRSKSILIEQNL